MVSLNNTEIRLHFCDNDDLPEEDEPSHVFFLHVTDDRIHIQTNWVCPSDGLLARTFDESNRSHADNVVFVVRQLTDAAIELLIYTEQMLVSLQKTIKAEAFRCTHNVVQPVIPGTVYYDAVLFKKRVKLAVSALESYVQVFMNRIGYEIGMMNGTNVALLTQEVRATVWSRDDAETPGILACLCYQDILQANIQGRLGLCSNSKYSLSFSCFFRYSTLRHYVVIYFARLALSSIQRLSGDDNDSESGSDETGDETGHDNDSRVPISGAEVESQFTHQILCLSALREDCEGPPFSLGTGAGTIQLSPSDESIEI